METLLNITKLQTHISKIIEYLNSHLPFINSHMVNFITDDHYTRFIPESIRKEILLMGNNNFYTLFWKINSNTPINSTEESNGKNVCSFLRQTQSMTLNCTDICMSLERFKTELAAQKINVLESRSPSDFMSMKKSHEVQLVCSIVAALCTSDIYDKPLAVVDIGGGKGYLSSLLSLEHNLTVLGIDSNNINTEGAEKRSKKLQKMWKGIVQRDKASSTEAKPYCPVKLQADIIKDNGPVDHKPKLACFYKQLTKFVTCSTDLMTLVKENFEDLQIDGICMTGLHTCGNLTPSSLQIYNANADVKAIINVGCCYHLLHEEFDDSSPKEESGFPMSQYLKQSRCKLGRNARMLAAQSLDRRICKEDLPSDSLFYRALLEVIFTNHKEKFDSAPVGRIGSKCKTFKEYVCKAQSKLGIDLKMTDKDLEELLKSHEQDAQHLNIFHLLRMSFASVIESVILLDRLLYLLENGHQQSYLVKLFNPVISPRCYGIVSFR